MIDDTLSTKKEKARIKVLIRQEKLKSAEIHLKKLDDSLTLTKKDLLNINTHYTISIKYLSFNNKIKKTAEIRELQSLYLKTKQIKALKRYIKTLYKVKKTLYIYKGQEI